MKKMHSLIWKGTFLLALGLYFFPASAQVTFKKITLSKVYIGEGVSVGDFNKDGHADVAAGPYLWLGPEFTTRYRIGPKGDTIYPITTYAHYDNTIRPADINNDGWLDVPVQMGLRNFTWLENPGKGKTGQLWEEHSLGAGMGGESAQFYPLFQDNKNVLVANDNFKDGFFGPLSWSEFDNSKGKWTWHIVSQKKYKANSHGIGVGDINGDGRKDIVVIDGWYEQPASLKGDPLWKYHPYLFSFNPYHSRENLGGSMMFVDDLNGDGKADVVSALESHGWGLAWFEQIKQGDSITFKVRMIMGNDKEKAKYGVAFSQLHSLGYVDIDGDGLKDIVTGKRYYAHNGVPDKDPEPNGAPVLYWFKQTRTSKGTTFVPHLIDSTVGSGTSMEEQKDMDGDGRPDIVTSSKKGTYIFLTRGH